MNNGNIKGKSTLSETSPQSNMARDKLTMGIKGNHKHDGSTDPTMKCDVLQYHDCTNVTMIDDVEIIDTKVIDAFSGWTECFALESADAITTAQVFYQEVITRYGCPKYILTDRGATFLSTLLKAFVKFWVFNEFPRVLITQRRILRWNGLIASYGSLYELWLTKTNLIGQSTFQVSWWHIEQPHRLILLVLAHIFSVLQTIWFCPLTMSLIQQWMFHQILERLWNISWKVSKWPVK